MAEPNLTESAWQRAKDDAAGVYPTTAFQMGGALVTLIFGAIAAVASADGSTSVQIAVPVLGGSVALGMTFLAVLACQLVAAPIRQRNALREAWTAPEVQNGIGVKLWNAYRKGKDLEERLDDEPAHNSSYDREQVEQWSEETAALLAEAVPAEIGQTFFAAGQYTDHSGRIQERTNALKKIIEDLG
jgi:hypothetical protein